jgi:hypothetical protein
MKTVRLASVVGFLLTLGVHSPVTASGPSLVFSVPGVIDAGGIGTYFVCTSTANDVATVTVNV